MNQLANKNHQLNENHTKPDSFINAREVFNIDVDFQVPAFTETSEHLPKIDDSYIFDKETTLAIIKSFNFCDLSSISSTSKPIIESLSVIS